MLYYQVCTRFFDNGKVDVSEVKVFEGDKIPENSSGSNDSPLCGFDYYYDYFKTESEAEQFRREALNA